MARPLRPHLPGAIYHITSRTQGKVSYFTGEIPSSILQILADALHGKDVRLLAIAVMSNHLHLIIQQGNTRIGGILQPPLTRIACLIQRVHGVENHVFGARYHAEPILEPEYLRTAIVYIHLNPVRAKLCDEPGRYSWTSHSLYADGTAPKWPDARLANLFALQDTLPLFATSPSLTEEDLRRDYRAYIRWRLDMDRAQANGGSNGPASEPPPFPLYYQDCLWATHFASLFPSPGSSISLHGDQPDASPQVLEPREIARDVLSALAPDLHPDEIRGRSGGSRLTAIRRAIILRMDALGYSGVQIAGWLRIDPSRVSRALATGRVRDRSTPVA
jgi:REP element-mobilizing transposase RayT